MVSAGPRWCNLLTQLALSFLPPRPPPYPVPLPRRPTPRYPVPTCLSQRRPLLPRLVSRADAASYAAVVCAMQGTERSLSMTLVCYSALGPRER